MNTESTDEKKVFNPEEAWRVLVGAVLGHEADLAATRLSPQGIFGKFGIALSFPAQNEFQGLLYVEPGASKNERVVRASVRRRGSDRVMNNFYFFDSSQEVLDWLKAEETVPLLVDTYRHLRDRLVASE